MEVAKKYRENGAIGALLDEYETSIKDLKNVITDVSPKDLAEIIDPHTKDKDCKSIQTILSHVVSSGYTYAIEVRKWKGEVLDYYRIGLLSTVEEYLVALDKMFNYTIQLFEDYPNIQLEEYHRDMKIKVRWGQYYDVEQLFEHAIVHILRHRRQIERFKLVLLDSKKGE